MRMCEQNGVHGVCMGLFVCLCFMHMRVST